MRGGCSWADLTVLPLMLFVTVEKRWLRSSGGRASLRPYRGFDPARPPVVVVHGFGPIFLVGGLVRRLHRAGRQVLVACYDNEGTAPSEAGAQLAGELARLRADHYDPGTPLDLVAHSLGGVVSRCALNALHEPGWLEGVVGAGDRGGWGRIRHRTADSPMNGYGEESSSNRRMRAFRDSPLREMYADSPMMRRLWSVELPDVDFRNLATFTRRGDVDWVRSAPELEPEALEALSAALTGPKEPAEPTLRNLARMLRADARFEQLRAGLEAGSGFVEAHDAAMPRSRGRHIWLLFRSCCQGPATVIGRLVEELGQGPPDAAPIRSIRPSAPSAPESRTDEGA